MTLVLVSHPSGFGHVVPPGHPERPDRLHAAMRGLDGAQLDDCLRVHDAPAATLDDVTLVHERAYAQGVLAACAAAGPDLTALDGDTFVGPGTGEAALRAVGAGMAGVDLVMQGAARRAFCAVRPPGHHAAPNRAMGFCLFNTIAIAARHARRAYGLDRIAIVDIDVHHGNGSQDVAESDADVFFASIHQGGIFPGSGHAHEIGPAGNIVNVPLPAFTEPEVWRAEISRRILPRLEAFQPELILVSAGFDGHRDDPLALFMLTENDYAWAAVTMRDAADALCDGRLVCLLEGGYDLDALQRSVAAFAGALAT